MASKRKASAMNATATDEPVDPSDELMFLCLGGGNEVGRSCHIIQYKGKTVMLDAGQHPAYDGLAALPFYDDFDLSTVDVLLISHFHIDHAASLPYVLAKTNFRGRVFMTHPTKAIYKWLIQDSVRVGNTASNSATQLYTEQDHLNTFPQIEAIDYHTTHTISSIRITPYPAGHVLGAAMFLIEIAGLNIFFTGDYSREQDRHLVSAEVPKGLKIDVLITESTYGIASHVPRLEREQALMKSITGILNRGGRALLPVFALGRAQELLLILDEYWGKHPEFQRFPIYYASNLARKCMVIYQTYVGAMNDNIKRLFRERMAEAEASGDAAGKNGPWDFKYIRSLKNLDRFDDVGGCVMLASPGMLQNGVSRELFERWAPSEKNGVIITGYSVEGTMARQIMQEPDQIQAVIVQEYSFAAHVDGVENREFIEEVAAPVVILVHGEQHNMMRLKSKLLSLNASKTTKVKVYSPRNCEELRIPFKADKTAKVVGKLASIPPPKDIDASAPLVTGVLVQNDFKLSLMAPEDLREYAGLNTTTITCKQRLTLSAAGVDLVRWALEGTFGAVEELPEMRRIKDGKLDGDDEKMAEDADEEVANLVAAYLVMGCVSVRYRTNGEVELEWEGNMLNDGIADSVMAVLFSVESSPAAVKRSSNGKHSDSHSHAESDDKFYAAQPDSKNPHAHVSPADRLERLMWFLEAQFGADNVAPVEDPKLPPLPASSKEEKKEEDDDNNDEEALKEEKANGDESEAKSDVKSEAMDVDEDAAKQQLQERQHKEIARLHKIGIPVPGISIKVDKMTATIWLEDLEVECNNKVFADRVRAVVERAVEVTAPLWG
ncbi:endoribonuclease ysh1 [Trichoderma virens FT-333]|nr:endoribonuclease ysh1 [Trichoderma virens FT-333]